MGNSGVEFKKEEPAMKNNLAVFGLGYVGTVTAACLASRGCKVYGVDNVEAKVVTIGNGEVPFYEPGLEALVKATRLSNNLTVTTDPEWAVKHSNIGFVCVGTPLENSGSININYVDRVVREIACAAAKLCKEYTIVIRSTVPVGTCEKLQRFCKEVHGGISVVMYPEFLREGNAVHDFNNPSLCVMGGESKAIDNVRSIIQHGVPYFVVVDKVSWREAELLKYVCNAYHALKICFANEIGYLADNFEVDPIHLMQLFCKDFVLNISPAYLRPGMPYGGSCLAKDLSYLTRMYQDNIPLLCSISNSNFMFKHNSISIIKDMTPRVCTLGFLGLAFKRNTDDIRYSAALSVLQQIRLQHNRNILVYDPHIDIDKLHGENKIVLDMVFQDIPISKVFVNLDSLIAHCDYIVITQSVDKEVIQKIMAAHKGIVDLVRLPVESYTAHELVTV